MALSNTVHTVVDTDHGFEVDLQYRVFQVMEVPRTRRRHPYRRSRLMRFDDVLYRTLQHDDCRVINIVLEVLATIPMVGCSVVQEVSGSARQECLYHTGSFHIRQDLLVQRTLS